MFRPSGSVRLFVIKEKQFSAENRQVISLLRAETGLPLLLPTISTPNQLTGIRSLFFDSVTLHPLLKTFQRYFPIGPYSQEISTGKHQDVSKLLLYYCKGFLSSSALQRIYGRCIQDPNKTIFKGPKWVMQLLSPGLTRYLPGLVSVYEVNSVSSV